MEDHVYNYSMLAQHMGRPPLAGLSVARLCAYFRKGTGGLRRPSGSERGRCAGLLRCARQREKVNPSPNSERAIASAASEETEGFEPRSLGKEAKKKRC